MFESAVLGHLIGDFVAQRDYVAANKKTNTLVCAWHCLLWTMSVAIMGNIGHLGAWGWLFVTHFMIDRTSYIKWWMYMNHQSEFRKRMDPWATILVDNLFHVLTIWVVYHFWDTGHGNAVSSSLITVFGLSYLIFVIDSVRSKHGLFSQAKAAEPVSMSEGPVQGS